MHASWMNPVGVWFGTIERSAIDRGMFCSVPDLNAKIGTFTWIKTRRKRIIKKL